MVASRLASAERIAPSVVVSMALVDERGIVFSALQGECQASKLDTSENEAFRWRRDVEISAKRFDGSQLNRRCTRNSTHA